MKIRSTIIGIALSLAGAGSWALSIGNAQGAAVVGQPLDVTYDIVADGDGDSRSVCAQADVFYGDTRVDPARVRLTTGAAPKPGVVAVRVLATTAVNEAVVSVVLRAGCNQTVSRRFVLLVDSPTRPAEEAAVSSGSGRAAPALRRDTAPAQARRPQPASAGQPTSDTPAGPAQIPPQAAKNRPRAPERSDGKTPQKVARGKSVPSTGAASVLAAPGRARLELQSPAEWLEDQALPLRFSADMATPGTEDPERRARAEATWRSLNALGADAPADRDARKLRELEQQVADLRTGLAGDRVQEAELRAEIARLREQRFPPASVWVAAATGLLLLLLLFAGFVWWRKKRREKATWWRPSQFDDSMLATRPENDRPPAVGRGATVTHDFVKTVPSRFGNDLGPTVLPAFAMAPSSPVGVSLDAAKRHGSGLSAKLLDPHAWDAATLLSDTKMPADNLRTASAGELVDLQQNAEFFVSLGQHEEAIALLQHYIDRHPNSSPEAYLYLLGILHALSLTDAYRSLRDRFNGTFNGDVPLFSAFGRSVRTLESYGDVLSRVQDSWAEPRVLDVLEDCLLRPRAGGPGPFELETYRELLLLYAIAKAEFGSTSTEPEARTLKAPVTPTDDIGLGASTQGPVDFELPIDVPAEPSPAGALAKPVAADIGFGPPPPTDDNLIDFDLFDVDVPSASKPLRR